MNFYIPTLLREKYSVTSSLLVPETKLKIEWVYPFLYIYKISLSYFFLLNSLSCINCKILKHTLTLNLIKVMDTAERTVAQIYILFRPVK
jgi:hypothetical protein